MKYLFAALFLALGAVASGNDCYRECRFKFCSREFAYELTLPDQPFTSKICLNGKPIGPGLTTGEAYIGTLPPKPISQANLRGLKQHFSPSFIKGISTKKGSALAHETPQSNQLRYLNEICVGVPIAHYTIKDDKGRVHNLYGKNKWKDCIAIELELPEILPTPHASAEPYVKDPVVRAAN